MACPGAPTLDWYQLRPTCVFAGQYLQGLLTVEPQESRSNKGKCRRQCLGHFTVYRSVWERQLHTLIILTLCRPEHFPWLRRFYFWLTQILFNKLSVSNSTIYDLLLLRSNRISCIIIFIICSQYMEITTSSFQLVNRYLRLLHWKKNYWLLLTLKTKRLSLNRYRTHVSHILRTDTSFFCLARLHSPDWQAEKSCNALLLTWHTILEYAVRAHGGKGKMSSLQNVKQMRRYLVIFRNTVWVPHCILLIIINFENKTIKFKQIPNKCQSYSQNGYVFLLPCSLAFSWLTIAEKSCNTLLLTWHTIPEYAVRAHGGKGKMSSLQNVKQMRRYLVIFRNTVWVPHCISLSQWPVLTSGL